MGVDKMAIFAHVDEIKKEKKYIATTVLEGFFILILLTTNFVLYSKKKKNVIETTLHREKNSKYSLQLFSILNIQTNNMSVVVTTIIYKLRTT